MEKSFLEYFFATIIIFLRMVKHCVFFRKKLGYRKRHSGKIAILANGPSLKSVLPLISTEEEFRGVEFSVHNFFAFSDEFFEVKPKFYALADPMFIKRTHRYDEVKRLFDVLENKVDWNITLYVPFRIKAFVDYSGITNRYIHIVRVNSYGADTWPRLLMWLFRKGYSCPFIGTVLQLNIFGAINEGFDEIRLYGADHTHICNLKVNDRNELCNLDAHFYDAGEPRMKPILRSDNGEVCSASDFLTHNGRLFLSHDLLRDYATYCHAAIINYTPGSMIDSYERHLTSKES